MKTKRPQRLAKVIDSDPAWEAAKASCRNVSPDDAVQESFYLQKQYRMLGGIDVGESPVDLNDILRVLHQKKIPFVLTGAHAIGSWTGRPRSTQDVDILV